MHRLVLQQGSVTDLPRIADFVEEACAGLSLESRTLYHIKMAVDEACSNVFEHAYEGKPGPLELEIEVTDREFVAHIRDWGKIFDPDNVQEPDPSLPLEERPIGGLGMYLIRKLMDRAEYHLHDHDSNCLILQKKLG